MPNNSMNKDAPKLAPVTLAVRPDMEMACWLVSGMKEVHHLSS
jgi:hypothetical protein